METEKIKYKRIIIPKQDRNGLVNVCRNLPYNTDIELGGYITPSSIYYTEGTHDNVPICGKHDIVFHTHPVREREDIPSELDILNLIFMDWKTSILFTRHRLIVLSKTLTTLKVIEEIDRTHEKHAMDVATLLKTEGPQSVFYYLVKRFVKNHVMKKGISHRLWPSKWDSFVTNCLKLDLKIWDCIPLSCAA